MRKLDATYVHCDRFSVYFLLFAKNKITIHDPSLLNLIYKRSVSIKKKK